MAQFTKYTSADASAPVLSGTAGALTTVLDACLVNGYGSKAAAGWGIAFTGASKRVYRAPSGARLYYRIVDDAPTEAATARDARLRGYVNMTTVDAGTGEFPSVAQAANGCFIRKSGSTDGTARAWIVYADARTVYMFVFPGGSDTNGGTRYRAIMFGEFYSFLANDQFNGCVRSRNTENSVTDTVETLDLLATTLSGNSNFMFIARGHTGLGGSVLAGAHTDAVKQQNSVIGAGALPFTNPANGGLYVSPVWVHDPTTTPTVGLRGRMRGFWAFLHPIASVTDGDSINGTGELAGKSFDFLKASGTNGLYTIETSNTLETN